VPLRNVARTTMPEERFHAQFGKDFCTELIKTPEGKARVQDALNRYFPYLPRFFGASNSRNNEMYRKYGLKQRRNEEMREDYMNRVRTLVEGLDLVLPEVPATA
jgi:ring-1,2-phenylacetyl-CoA epoxidase subunit PaaA